MFTFLPPSTVGIRRSPCTTGCRSTGWQVGIAPSAGIRGARLVIARFPASPRPLSVRSVRSVRVALRADDFAAGYPGVQMPVWSCIQCSLTGLRQCLKKVLRGRDRMHVTSLADDLADTRAEIARLKQREAALRAAILERRGQVPEGRWVRIEMVEKRARVFDKSLLPDEIRKNPRFYRDQVTTHVRCLPVFLGGARPEGSPRRPTKQCPLPAPVVG